MPTKCLTHNCAKPAEARGLCNTHYMRLRRHGSTGQTRPADWGSKEKHPSYRGWCGLRRSHMDDIPANWANDFWAFVAETPAKPEGRVCIQKVDRTKSWGPDNFYWKEPILSVDARTVKSEYMRDWSRKARAANPEYHKSAYLKRRYGITLTQYRVMLENQAGVCAICKKPESNEIRGTLLSLAVDHDHATGAVRALLCTACNTGLGNFSDSPERLQAALIYLERHRLKTDPLPE